MICLLCLAPVLICYYVTWSRSFVRIENIHVAKMATEECCF